MSERAGTTSEWQRVDPLAVLVNAVAGLRKAVLPMIAVLFGTQMSGDAPGWVVWAVLAALLVANTIGPWLGWLRLRYRVGQSDIRVEQGLVSRQARSVPYERIQDVSLEAGPVARAFGLVEVRFETGAGGKDELKLAYVKRAEGERLREVVRDLRDDAQGLAAPASAETEGAASDSAPLFAMTPRRVLLFGIFEFSLVVIAVLGGAAQQLDFLLPFDIWDFDGWEDRLAGPGQWLAGLGYASRVVGAVVAAAALIAIGVITGVARTALRDWDFRLDRNPRGFRRRRGLLTKTDLVMPVHRVQASIVSTGLLRRLWGWHGLSFVSLAQDSGKANHDVAPFAQLAEIAPIAAEAGFALPAADIDWHRPSPRYRFDRAALGAAVPMIAGLIALALAPSLWPGVALVLVAAFVALRQMVLWRFERHAVGARHIISRRGWLAPRTQIADRVKLHSVTIAQGPLAQRRGYADLRFGLAGGTMAFSGLPLNDAGTMREAVLASIASRDFSELT